MLNFQDVSYRYPSDSHPTIEHLSFSVPEGAFCCIIGPSGCGKSTIFRLINGLLPPDSGTIQLAGKSIAGRKGYCGYMPQKDLLFPWRTVGENVALPLEISGMHSKSARRARVEDALREVGLDGCADKMPHELSGGMRQRAAFARTNLTGQPLLLLDEPFSALDYFTRITMREWLLEQWAKHRKTVLFITHDVEEALFLSSTILVAEATPIRRLVEVPVPRPAGQKGAFFAQPEIIALREALIQRLKPEAAL
ncbi:MAG: ABC transporter ATP-binding protein [Ndongobacter sp.]|nr:ABC transporter ATP-binding protein [Ndongobacter sp.]